jgi:hypothetical protein
MQLNPRSLSLSLSYFLLFCKSLFFFGVRKTTCSRSLVSFIFLSLSECEREEEELLPSFCGQSATV